MSQPGRPDHHRRGTSTTAVDHTQPKVSQGSSGVRNVRRTDVFLFLAILFSLVWPWAFFGALATHHGGGVQFQLQLADYVVGNPQLVSAFVTFVGTVDRIISAFFFKQAIDRFSQEWVRERDVEEDRPVSVFTLSTLLAFRHNSLMWELSELGWKKRRWVWVLLLVACTTGFALIPTGIVALITPGPFTVSQPIPEVEIDLTMRGSACSQWWETSTGLSQADCTSKPLPNSDTGPYAIGCLGTTASDVFSSAVANMLHLRADNTEPSSLTMVGRKNVLHFLGPGRGVLPMGPNGGPAFNPSEDLFLDTINTRRSYAYKMDQQGLNANATCEYSTSSPIAFSKVESSSLNVTGWCDQGWADVSAAAVAVGGPIRIPKGLYKTLGSWVCQSPSETLADTRYMIYLALEIHKDDPLFSNTNTSRNLVNITCTIPPLDVRSYEVTFNSSSNQFQVLGEAPPASSPINPDLDNDIGWAFRSYILGETARAIPLMQNSLSNMLVESVITSGVKIFESPAAAHGQEQLRLYAAMLNGIMEYFGTAGRARIWSMSMKNLKAIPEECLRSVNGSISYQVIGWKAKPSQVYFLLPFTIANVVTLVVLLAAARKAWGRPKCHFDPTDVRSVVKVSVTRQHPTDPSGTIPAASVEWEDRVRFYSRREA